MEAGPAGVPGAAAAAGEAAGAPGAELGGHAQAHLPPAGMPPGVPGAHAPTVDQLAAAVENLAVAQDAGVMPHPAAAMGVPPLGAPLLAGPVGPAVAMMTGPDGTPVPIVVGPNGAVVAAGAPPVPQPPEPLPPTCVLRMRGLPYQADEDKVAEFFADFKLAGTLLCLNSQGRATGDGYVRFATEDDATRALETRNRAHMGRRYVELFPSTEEDFANAMQRSQMHAAAAAQAAGALPGRPDPRYTGVVRMRGLPFSAGPPDIVSFFNGCGGELVPEGILLTYTADGRATGEAYVEFTTEEGATQGLQRHRQTMGTRYIELFRSSKGEMMQAAGAGARSLFPGGRGSHRGGHGGGFPGHPGLHGLPPSFGGPRGGHPGHPYHPGAVAPPGALGPGGPAFAGHPAAAGALPGHRGGMGGGGGGGHGAVGPGGAPGLPPGVAPPGAPGGAVYPVVPGGVGPGGVASGTVNGHLPPGAVGTNGMSATGVPPLLPGGSPLLPAGVSLPGVSGVPVAVSGGMPAGALGGVSGVPPGVVPAGAGPHPVGYAPEAVLPSDGLVLKLRGLPYSSGVNEVRDFFDGFQLVPNGVLVVMRNDRHTGEAYVMFASAEECARARETRNKARMGPRYVELFRSSHAEFAQAAWAMGSLNPLPPAPAPAAQQGLLPPEQLHLMMQPGMGGAHHFLHDAAAAPFGAMGMGNLFGYPQSQPQAWAGAGPAPMGMAGATSMGMVGMNLGMSLGPPPGAPVDPAAAGPRPPQGQLNPGAGGFAPVAPGGSGAPPPGMVGGPPPPIGGPPLDGQGMPPPAPAGAPGMMAGAPAYAVMAAGGAAPPSSAPVGQPSAGGAPVPASGAPPAGGNGGSAPLSTEGQPTAAPAGAPPSSTVHFRGLPFSTTPHELIDFLAGFEVLPGSVRIGQQPDGRATGDAWVSFANVAEAARAVAEKQRGIMGNRCIELSLL